MASTSPPSGPSGNPQAAPAPLVHADDDLDAFLAQASATEGPDPEPVLLEM